MNLSCSLMQVCVRYCAVCDESLSSHARFDRAVGCSPEGLIRAGVCPMCLSMPPVSGRDTAALRAAWLAVVNPITKPGVGLPFDLI